MSGDQNRRARGGQTRTGILKYSRHKAKRSGVIRYPRQPDGRRPAEYLPGEFESAEMMDAYHRSMAHWLAEGTVPPWVGKGRRRTPTRVALPSCGPTVDQICDLYQEWAARHYSPGEAQSVRYALAPLRVLYGDLAAQDFGRRELVLLRASRLDAGNCRNYINKNVDRICRAWNLAAEREQIPDECAASLSRVKRLRKVGADGQPDRAPVGPVSDETIDLTCRHLPEAAADLVRVLRAVGCRCGELFALMADDLVWEADDLWSYTPVSHKSAHRGIVAVRYFSERTIPILRKWIERGSATGHVFTRPQWTRTQDRRGAGRPWCRTTFGGIIRRTCERHGLPRWHPHQLRHACATAVYNSGASIEAAKLQLGHTSHQTTERYIRPDNELAKRLARDIC